MNLWNTKYWIKERILPEENTVPVKEQNCTINFLAETATGQSSQYPSQENFCLSAAYKLRSQLIWPLLTKTSRQAGPGYKHSKSRNLVNDLIMVIIILIIILFLFFPYKTPIVKHHKYINCGLLDSWCFISETMHQYMNSGDLETHSHDCFQPECYAQIISS